MVNEQKKDDKKKRRGKGINTTLIDRNLGKK
jgi:hypothetical protein